MRPLWFRNKTYGWGWVPATWQGWMVMLAYILVVAADGALVLRPVTHPYSIAAFVGIILAATLGLLVVTYYTGERPRWHWGARRDESEIPPVPWRQPRDLRRD